MGTNAAEDQVARPTRPFLLFFLVMGMAGSPIPTAAQALIPPPDELSQWDTTNQVLFVGYGGLHPGSLIRGYVDTRQRGAAIDVFKDFPRLQEAIIDGLTAGPDGTSLIAAVLNFGDRKIRRVVLTYDSAGHLLRSWDPAPQYAEAIVYTQEDDAVFVLGDRDVPDGPSAPDYPLLVEYSREGQVLKGLVPAHTLKDRADSFDQGGKIGQPALRVTKDRIYFYAPANREAVTCDRNGVVLAYRNIGELVDKISVQDGYHLIQIHNVDFSADGNIVLELLLGDPRGYALDVFRINIETGEAVPVHKAFNGTGLFFMGVKDGHYLYLANGHELYVQLDETLEPVPLTTALETHSRVP